MESELMQIKETLALAGITDIKVNGVEVKCFCCPECGCEKYDYKDWIGKGYRVCINCDQEWWTDIDYGKSRLEATHFIEQFKNCENKLCNTYAADVVIQTRSAKTVILSMNPIEINKLDSYLQDSLVLGCKTLAIFKIKFKE